MRSILQHLHGEIIKKDSPIRELQNRVSEVEKRVTEGERYSSKDCLIFEEMPVKDPKQPLSHQFCDFLNSYLSSTSNPSNFETCHYLGKTTSQLYPLQLLSSSFISMKKRKFLAGNLG